MISTTLYKKPFVNIVGKGENASYQPFLFFPQCFLPFHRHISIFVKPACVELDKVVTIVQCIACLGACVRPNSSGP